MTENDLLLIKLAFEADEWNEISDLENQAESDQAKRILHDRKVRLYDKEEAFAGLF